MLSTELIRWHIFHEVQHRLTHSRQAASFPRHIQWDMYTLLRCDDLLGWIKSIFFDTIKTRNYWPTIITGVHAERFLERKFSIISRYFNGKRWLKNPNLFPTLFFISSRILDEVAFLAPPFWICHYLPGGSANFPDKLDRWRHIQNRRGRLGTRLLIMLIDMNFHIDGSPLCK